MRRIWEICIFHLGRLPCELIADENGVPLSPTTYDWRIASIIIRDKESLATSLCPKCDSRAERIPRTCGVCGAKWRYQKGKKVYADPVSLSKIDGKPNIMSLIMPQGADTPDRERKRDRFFGPDE